MPRPKRADEANCLYHALNRGNARCAIFKKDADYHAFERILAEGLERYPCRILSYQLMKNHWHLVVQPTEDGGMSHFLRWVTLTRNRSRVGALNQAAAAFDAGGSSEGAVWPENLACIASIRY